MPELAEVWKTSLPTVLNNVTGRGVWTAINAAVPIVVEDGTLVLGIPSNDTELAGHLRLPNTSRQIETAFSKQYGSPIRVRVIGGTSIDDYEIVKRRDAERRRMQEAEMSKLRQELQAKNTWEGVYEQLSRRFSAMSNRSLPQNKARFYAEAVDLVAETRKEHQEFDDMSERNFARCLERISQYSDVPSTLVAEEVLKRAGEL
jgi:hypothetical protein